MKKPNFPEPIQNVLRDSGLRSRYMLNLSLWANLLVAAFKLILGIAVQSFWLGAVGVFYGVLALMRFSLLRSFRRETPDAEQRAYRRTALLLNVLTLTMTGGLSPWDSRNTCKIILSGKTESEVYRHGE